MQDVIVLGASGYSGLELLKLLSRHPSVRVAAATSNRWAGTLVADHVPAFSGSSLRFVEHGAVEAHFQPGRVAFLATPAQTSHDIAPRLLASGLTVIDLSGAFRLGTTNAQEAAYGFPHQHPNVLGRAHYGLPELFDTPRRGSTPLLIANPGCYATAASLALAPLIRHDLLEAGQPLILDGKSGATGAGKKVDESLLYSEVADTIRPYRVAGHQHTPEIERTLGTLSSEPILASFTAHLLPMRRGLLVSAYGRARSGVGQADLDAAYRSTYEGRPFVRVLNRPAHPGPVLHSNFCDVSATLDTRTGTVLAFGAIDNLLKGAAGQAVQNLNLMLGIDVTSGLLGARH